MFGRKKTPKREMPFETRQRRYGKVTVKYPKTYTLKQWKRFSPDIQQELTNRYTVTISDYKTRNQIIKQSVKQSPKKIVKGARRIDSGLMKFNKVMNKVDVGLREIDKAFPPPRKGKSTLDRLAGY